MKKDDEIITVKDEHFNYFDLFCHQCVHPDKEATPHMCDTCRARVLTPTNFVSKKKEIEQ